MSGQAGAFDPGGGPIDRVRLAEAMAQVQYRGREGMTCWQEPGVALAFAAFARTPEAVAERQPFRDEASGLCVTFDGRLDNRGELSSALDLAAGAPDAAIVAAAYRRWGLALPERLLGDFSLVVYDAREQRLLAARDVMGLRPLYYRVVNGVWWWASDQQALRFGDAGINEGYVGELLSCRLTTIDETIYAGIHRLPKAHALAVTAAGFRRWRYWRPGAAPAAAPRDARECEVTFRSLLKEAVRARLRVNGRPALFLSSGIDSSSVAAQVAALRREGDAAAARVTAYTMTLPGSPACEGALVGEIVRGLELPSRTHPAREAGHELFERDAAASLDLPEEVSSSLMAPLRDTIVRAGHTVALTGYGGDDWFDTSFGELGDLLRQGRAIAAGRWLAAMALAPDAIPRRQMLRHGAWMALPPAVKRAIRIATRADAVPPWIEPAFAHRVNLRDRIRGGPEPVPFASLASADLFHLATGGEAHYRLDHEERVYAARGLELWHPLMDRRLIEFALTLPPAVRSQGGVSKSLMRRAMTGLLPAPLTGMPPPSDYSFLTQRALARLGGSGMLAGLEPVCRGWLRPDRLARMYGEMEQGAVGHQWPICAAVGVDYWLRALETHRVIRYETA